MIIAPYLILQKMRGFGVSHRNMIALVNNQVMPWELGITRCTPNEASKVSMENTKS
jgi:hypothetical protein